MLVFGGSGFDFGGDLVDRIDRIVVVVTPVVVSEEREDVLSSL